MASQDAKRIAAADLTAFAARVLEAGGCAADAARLTAELLVWANARGIDSHGVLRIPRYIEMMQLGEMNGKAEPRIVSGFGAIAVLEGDRAPGAVCMTRAMTHAIELARSFGIGWCSARNMTHAGAVGYFAEMAVRADHIGIVMTASKPLMGYVGARAEGVSTNPIAIAAPNPHGGGAIILDMSTSAAALGKIMAAKEAGVSIPLGWGVDANGRDTTDPKAVKVLLPMASAKGAGLSLMIEVLGSVLVANPLIAPALSGNSKGSFNGIAIALNVRAFGDLGDFHQGMVELGRAIKNLPRAEGVSEILLPGERGAASARDASATGIALESATAAKLAKLARVFGLPVPDALA